jgi:predicted membrane-bound mannosyltransferase
MIRRQSLAALFSVTVLAVAATGCGSSPDTLSAAAFRTKANALCKVAQTEMTQLKGTISDASTQAEADAVVTKIANRADKLAKALDALAAPDELNAGVTGLVSSVRSIDKQLRSGGLAYVTQHPDPFNSVTAKSIKLGLPGCAGGA